MSFFLRIADFAGFQALPTLGRWLPVQHHPLRGAVAFSDGCVNGVRGMLPRGRSLPDTIWAERHRRILLLLWLHVPGLFAFAVFRGYSLLHSLTEAALVVTFAIAAETLYGHRRVATVVASLGLLTCSALLVHLSGGVVEAHFHYFVIVGVVTLYQDWLPFLVAVGYVVVQHGVLGAVAPGSVFNHRSAVEHPWRWAGIHGLSILAMSFAAVASWKFNELLGRATADREAQLREAQAVARLGSWEYDVETGRLTWSDELYRLAGVDAKTFTPSLPSILALVHPADRDLLGHQMRSSFAGAEVEESDFRVLLADGTVRWLHRRGKVTCSPDGRPLVVSGTATDVTERKRVEAELEQALSLLSSTIDSTADALLVVDLEGRICLFNQRFTELWRIPEDVLASGDDERALAVAVDQLSDPEAFMAKVRDLYAHPEVGSFDTLEFRDGRAIERLSKPQRVDGKTVGRVWTFRDVTDHRRLEQELAHQAFHDSLTGLANQALFRDRVEHAVARTVRQGARLAVVVLDLDHFKTVNDSLGHAVGDEMLVMVAERIRGCVRAGDTVARLGGDEFAVLLEDLAAVSDTLQLVDRVNGAMQRPFNLAGREVCIGASVGIALDGPGVDSGQLLRNADIAMYTAKRGGRGRHEIFVPAMHQAAMERMELEAALRKALERRELTIEYQPVVTLATGAITGVEALVRWHDAERGPVPPSVFIPVAEETGLIGELGRQVLSAACTQVRQWQLEHRTCAGLKLSVNLSPRQLQAESLVDEVREALNASGLAPASLVLEITEGAVMNDAEAAVVRLHALKALGVRLAVDDFGTGYSSLSYLQRFPIDILKIDRAFVHEIDLKDVQASLVAAIVSLAQSLRLHAVAEGVETAAQVEALTGLGCGFAQGYHFARPMPPAALEPMLQLGSVRGAAARRIEG
jgi:diguanylate cyclase (GGDEF)-like protein/PAS domain S-box-containing protein